MSAQILAVRIKQVERKETRLRTLRAEGLGLRSVAQNTTIEFLVFAGKLVPMCGSDSQNFLENAFVSLVNHLVTIVSAKGAVMRRRRAGSTTLLSSAFCSMNGQRAQFTRRQAMT
jgi:hypothetical protein